MKYRNFKVPFLIVLEFFASFVYERRNIYYIVKSYSLGFFQRPLCWSERFSPFQRKSDFNDCILFLPFPLRFFFLYKWGRRSDNASHSCCTGLRLNIWLKCIV